MNNTHFKRALVLIAAVMALFFEASAEPVVASGFKTITSKDALSREANQWIAFRKDVTIDKMPAEAIARISADSKYWLWINGKLAVFEGSLKRGPNYTDSYVDEVDLKPFLKKGSNKIALLLWYFGKDGFSHVDSGMPQLFFDCEALGIESDDTWRCMVHPAFGTAVFPKPNYRLSESSILFDAGKDIEGWQTAGIDGFGEPAVIRNSSLGSLHRRPIPMWKDFGIKRARTILKEGADADTVVAHLPYNMQFTPVITVCDSKGGGHNVMMYTNHIMGGSEPSVHAEYITKAGKQTYENLGWMNGEELFVIVPHGMKVRKVQYRETGYAAECTGKFRCDNDFINRFWGKALHTLYVNMRDTYFDCPDRERAQWWGDATLLSAETIYTYSTEASLLTRKAIHELCAWQKEDGTLFSPIPGNYRSELPAQMLASVGRYGFWTYYMNTGDLQTIIDAYPSVKKYLNVWELEPTGLTGIHAGGWNWGDWGDNRDIRLIQSAWYYMALSAASEMAALCGCEEDIPDYQAKMALLKEAFNTICWTGTAYRHPEYGQVTDDRVQALAVVSGIAPEEWYDAIFETLKEQEHASPYMEKYVMEALFQMGHGDYAMERMQKRFANMVNNEEFSTLWEGWGILDNGFGGGTTNHAWSGGAMIVIAQKVVGITPIEPGYKSFRIAPTAGIFGKFSFSMPSVQGKIAVSLKEKKKKSVWRITVPEGTTAHILLPGEEQERTVQGGRYRFVVKH
ncbi:MAG: glycoside hydrolase [Bacteroidales bacterium]|nr:glycoside hydrolase [Candidatus Cacconaster merdequi]